MQNTKTKGKFVFIYIYIYIFINDILLWTPSHERAKTRRPTRTYIQQLCADTGCSLEDLMGAMDDRDGWRVRVRQICADGATYIYIYICHYIQTSTHTYTLYHIRNIYLQSYEYNLVLLYILLWCNGKQARLANLHEWVQFSLGAPFIRPCATSKQKAM